MEKTNKILKIAGKWVEVRHNTNISKTCLRCCFKRGNRECSGHAEDELVPCINFENLQEGYAYFVPAKKKRHKIRFKNMAEIKAELQKSIDKAKKSEIDLEAEIKKMIYDPFYDLNGVAIKGATAFITVEDVATIARHFAKWGAEHLKK